MINWISRGIYRAARTRPFTLLLIVALLVSVNAPLTRAARPRALAVAQQGATAATPAPMLTPAPVVPVDQFYRTALHYPVRPAARWVHEPARTLSGGASARTMRTRLHGVTARGHVTIRSVAPALAGAGQRTSTRPMGGMARAAARASDGDTGGQMGEKDNGVSYPVGGPPPGGIQPLVAAGAFTSYPLPNQSSYPYEIIKGPNNDGLLWSNELGSNKIAWIAPNGTGLTEFTIPYSDPTYHTSLPYGIVAGPDGNVWFTEFYGDKIGRLTRAGVFTEFTVPLGRPGEPTSADPNFITAGPDGNLWFTTLTGNAIGRITHAGAITLYNIPGGSPGNTTSTQPEGITTGPDGKLWFTENSPARVASISTGGTFTSYTLPTATAGPLHIVSG